MTDKAFEQYTKGEWWNRLQLERKFLLNLSVSIWIQKVKKRKQLKNIYS